MSLLSTSDVERIEQAIARVESTTAGEIVVVVAPRSEGYELWRGAPALGLTLLTPPLLATLAASVPVFSLLLLQFPLFLLSWWALGRPAVLRRLVPGSMQAAAVDARAKQLFLERGLTETRDRSGVLLFISELEHRVQFLADKGIHARVGVEGWAQHVQLVTRAFAEGKAAEGILAALEAVGAELAAAFPPRSDDRNEMPDQVIVVP